MQQSFNNLEILAPAGSFDKMKIAFQYGADAVYAGLPFYSLRARTNSFSKEEIVEAIHYARKLNKKFYLTANIFARNLKLNSFRSDLEWILKQKPDAMIMSDPGLIQMVQDINPEQEIHLSVQANCMNWEAARFWKEKVGIQRLILSRELRLIEIEEIKKRLPDLELEAFVHGSLCIAYSGRCLMSHYMSYRDANQGVCDNSCRYPMKVFGQKPESTENTKSLFLEDFRNPGELYEMDEDEHGSYIMNSKDLCLVDKLKELIEAGIISFKIEGRTKSEFYLALVVWCYRNALDAIIHGKEVDPNLLKRLETLTTRGYTRGFLEKEETHESLSYQHTKEKSSAYLGRVKTSGTTAVIDVRGKILKGQIVEVLVPEKIMSVRVLQIFNSKGEELEQVHSGQNDIKIVFDQKLEIDQFLMKPINN